MAGVTNKKFVNDPNFQRACRDADTAPTPRQASKFRNRKGKAFLVRHDIGALQPDTSFPPKSKKGAFRRK